MCRQRNNNLYVWQLTRKTQPRPQGFTLKKWVGRPTQFLREKPWGRGWEKRNRVFLKFSHETFKLRAWNKLGISPAGPETSGKRFLFGHNKSLSTKLIPSRWLDIGLTFLLTSTSSRSINTQKRTISSYLDLLSAKVSNAYVVHLTANQNTGLVSSCSLARGFNLTLRHLAPDMEYRYKSERSVLALKMGLFWWVKYSPIFVSNLAPLNQGQ